MSGAGQSVSDDEVARLGGYIVTVMDDAQIADIAAWLTQAGLAGDSESATLAGFCKRCVAAGVPIARALVLIDTLHRSTRGAWCAGATRPAKCLCSTTAVPPRFPRSPARERMPPRSRERLDFTVIGPAVNETSRIASMCRSADQPMLVSDTFARVGDNASRLVSVGRYALRGVGRPQELFTLDPAAAA